MIAIYVLAAFGVFFLGTCSVFFCLFSAYFMAEMQESRRQREQAKNNAEGATMLKVVRNAED